MQSLNKFSLFLFYWTYFVLYYSTFFHLTVGIHIALNFTQLCPGLHAAAKFAIFVRLQNIARIARFADFTTHVIFATFCKVDEVQSANLLLL